MDEKISIIIPLYNVEKYLRKCVDSLLCQTYRNLEIILVDDGSTDGCPEICDSYAAGDERVVVIHKEHARAAEARNAGLARATGSYISFADSDDWLSEQAYELFMREMKEKQADCVVGGSVRVTEKKGKWIEEKKNFSGKAESREPREVIRHVLLNTSAVWNRLFRRELFEGLCFTPGRINDDEHMALKIYARCKQIVFLDCPTYYYRARAGSITQSRFSMHNVACFYNAGDIMQWTAELYPEFLPLAERKWLRRLLYCYVGLRNVPEGAALRREFHEKLKENRRKAWNNRYMGFPGKCAFILAGILPVW